MKAFCFIGSLLACSADPRGGDLRAPIDPPGAPSPSDSTMQTLSLTATAPQHDLVQPAIASPPTTLTLAISAIENPARQAFSLRATAHWTDASGAAIEQPIGNVTPYPATEPGSFSLGVPRDVAQQLTRANRQLTLRLALVPIAAAQPLVEPLRVVVGAPAWR